MPHGAYGAVTLDGSHALKHTPLFDDCGDLIGSNVHEAAFARHQQQLVSGSKETYRNFITINDVKLDTHKSSIVIDMEAGRSTVHELTHKVKFVRKQQFQ
jgi:hypothetical protein